MAEIEIVDVTDEAHFALIPPCANPGFDHRSCDYWEDADRGSKTARSSWLPGAGSAGSAGSGGRSDAASSNPFAPQPRGEVNPFAPTHSAQPNPFASERSAQPNPFAPKAAAPIANPFLDDREVPLADNPFAPRKPSRPTIAAEAPRKLQLLGRGLGVFGSYAKVLLVESEPAAYCQFGPLSAYPRALRLRELYPRLPQAPLPAVISCIATTAEARHKGYAARLVTAVCDDLAGRGFSAVESYPEVRTPEDSTPAARPAFWIAAGFKLAVDDERYPVLRREL